MKLKKKKNSIDSKRLVCVKSGGTIFNFKVFKSSLDFASDIYNGKISFEKAENSQYKMFELLDYLKEYNPTELDKVKPREETLNDAKKLYKNRSSVIKAFENGDFPFNYGFQKENPDMSDKALPNWVKVSKKRFDTIKNAVQNAKRDNLQARPQHTSPINFDNSNKLIQDIAHGNITYKEALNKTADIDNNFAKIIGLESYYPNQIKMVNIYYTVSEIFTGEAKELVENNDGKLILEKSKSDHSDEQKESNTARQRFAEQPNEQPDTTDMPDLESEESAAQGKEQKAKGLRILTPNQILNRLTISLAQLKQEIIQKNLKMKSDNYCILCTDQKNLQNKSIKV